MQLFGVIILLVVVAWATFRGWPQVIDRLSADDPDIAEGEDEEVFDDVRLLCSSLFSIPLAGLVYAILYFVVDVVRPGDPPIDTLACFTFGSWIIISWCVGYPFRSMWEAFHRTAILGVVLSGAAALCLIATLA